MLKAISEISVPKVVEKIVEKIIEKPGATSQEGGDKEGAEKSQTKDSETSKKSPPKQSKQQQQQQQKPKRPIIKGIVINPTEGSSSQKPKESEVQGKGKKVDTSDPKATPKQKEDTSKDEELAKKIEEEERIKASAIRNEQQIKDSELRIWPVWTKEKIAKIALPAADPYWLHPVASQRVNLDANNQLDMPICPRAFIFKYMDPVPFFNGDDELMNRILIDF